MRKSIVNAVNRLSKESGSLDFELIKAYNIIFAYQKESKKAIFEMNLELKNGVLYIDGKSMERVAPLIRPFNIEDLEADFYENRILAKSGLWQIKQLFEGKKKSWVKEKWLRRF